MRFTKRTSKRAWPSRPAGVTMQDALELLEEWLVPTPVDPTPEWVRARLLRLARDLRAQAAAIAKLARDMED